LSEGCYLLRSNVTDRSAEDLWRANIQLTEAEAAFRIHKSDLDLRPVWHQKQERVEAPILVCFWAYVLWNTLAQTCRTAGLGDEPRKVFEELSKVTLVDVALPTRRGITIRKRCVSRPTEHQTILLQRLGLHLCSEDLPLPQLKPKTLFFKLRKLDQGRLRQQSAATASPPPGSGGATSGRGTRRTSSGQHG
jgi:hypothetical protein